MGTVQTQAWNRMNLHHFGLFFFLVLAAHGAPKPNPKPSPKPNPKPIGMGNGQVAIIWNNGGRQRVELPGTGKGPYDHNGYPYHGNGGFSSGGFRSGGFRNSGRGTMAMSGFGGPL